MHFCGNRLVVGLSILMFAVFMSPAFAQTETAAALTEANISLRKTFIMLFLMLVRSKSSCPSSI